MSVEPSQSASSSTSRVATSPGNNRHNNNDEKASRAPQACLRCRSKKLRCMGGCPCLRCTRAKELCDFGSRPPDYDQTAGLDPTIRIAQLERTVADLLNGLANGNAAQVNKAAPGPIPFNPIATDDTAPQNLFETDITENWATNPGGDLAALTEAHPLFTPLLCPSVLPSANPPNDRHVTFGPSPVESQPGSSTSRNKNSPEDRLAAAGQTGEGYAPFQPLTYQPTVWVNREQSRRSSPQPGQSRDETWQPFEAKAGPKDDPLSTELVDLPTAVKITDL